MNIQQALDYMLTPGGPKTRLGLERITELMKKLGDPQKQLRFIHVAGTNGKGSTCAMLASILTKAGYTTGLYTSPHLLRVNERMKINGVDISDEELIELAERVKPVTDWMEDEPTEFERITAMAFMYFQQRKCDVVVLEVGLGGRLDSTNVIDAPDAAVITHIALEHTQILGDTLKKIAVEKAGIIKKNTPVALYGQSREVEQTVQKICTEKGGRLWVSDLKQLKVERCSLNGQNVSYRARQNLQLPLLGEHQAYNMALTLDTVDLLVRKRGYHISDEAIREGLACVTWPGRLEVLRESPVVLVDGAHNPDGVQQLATAMKQYAPGQEVTFVMGVMADKDYMEMAGMVAPYARQFITVAPEYHRALDARSLRETIERELNVPARCGGSVRQGLELALTESKPEDTIVIFGSLYQVGEVRAWFGK